MKEPNKIVLEKLIEKIEFDKEKNIKVKLTFQNPLEDAEKINIEENIESNEKVAN